MVKKGTLGILKFMCRDVTVTDTLSGKGIKHTGSRFAAGGPLVHGYHRLDCILQGRFSKVDISRLLVQDLLQVGWCQH